MSFYPSTVNSVSTYVNYEAYTLVKFVGKNYFLFIFFISMIFIISLPSRVAASTPSVDNYFSKITLKDIELLVKNNDVKSIDQLLEILPLSLKSNVLFVTNGEGLLHGSHTEPIVILWNEPGGISLTFQSSQVGEKAKIIEAFEYSSRDNKIEFLELDFADAERRFKPNSSCVECHGSNEKARPIWKEYPKWEGSIGSDDDVMTSHDQFLIESFWPENPRIKPLIPNRDEIFWTSSWPLRPDKQEPNYQSQLLSRPNMQFGLFANRITLGLATNKIEGFFKLNSTSPNFKDYVDFLGSVAGCNEILPPNDILKQVDLRLSEMDIRSRIDDEIFLSLSYEQVYFDGSATLWELLLGRLLIFFEVDSNLDYSSVMRTLSKKYPPVSPVNRDLTPWFQFYDQFGSWFPLPFPRPLVESQNREPWSQEKHWNYKGLCEQLTLTKEKL